MEAPAQPNEAIKGQSLSPQETRVLAYSSEGLSDKEIAKRLEISLDTVRTYWQRIRSKIGGGTRGEIVARLNRDAKANLEDEVARTREIEQKLRDSQERYRSAIESTIDCFFMLDSIRDAHGQIVDFRYTEVNGLAMSLMGRSREELAGLTLLTTHEDGRLAPYVAAYAQVVETGETFESEIETDNAPNRALNLRAGRVGDGVAVILRDVTALKAQQRQVEAQNERLRQLSAEREATAAKASAEHEFLETVLGTIDCLVCVLDREGRIVRFNPACERASGWSAAEVLGETLWDKVIPLSEKETLKAIFRDLTAGHFPKSSENHWISRTGERRLIAFRNTCILDAHGEVEFMVGTGIDITQSRATADEARRTNERLELAQKIAGIGSWEMNISTQTIRLSDHMCVLLGYEPAQGTLSLETILQRVPEQETSRVRTAVRKCLETMEDVEFKHKVVRANGEVRVLHTLCHHIPHEGTLVGTTVDVTERDRWEAEVEAAMLRTVEESVQLELQQHELTLMNEKLTHLATTDGLTGVANHRTFQERLDEMMLASRRSRRPMSVVLMDVDRFKMFNDDFGHQAGDAVLRGVVAALSGVCRNGDLVARYGGEEFAVILKDADAHVARVVVERFRKAIESHPWSYRAVTASFGVATLSDGVSREQLIELADRSLYASKGAGRNRCTHADDLVPAGVAILEGCEPSPSSSSPSPR